MIRTTLLYCFVIALIVVATRRWFYALCLLMILTVFMQHNSMPTSMLGIPGLNLWNVSLLAIVLCWLRQHRPRPAGPPNPLAPWNMVFFVYLLTIVLIGLGGLADVGALRKQYVDGVNLMLMDGIINPLKFAVLGLLFYDGTRTRQNIRWVLLATVGSGLLYGLMMFKTLGPRVFTIDYRAARRATDKLIGLHANDMAEVLAFAVWGAVVICLILPKRWQQAFWVAIILAVIPTFTALKSRAGFFAFSMVGVTLGVLRWRRLLVLLPVLAAVGVVLDPSIRERVLMGFGEGIAQESDNWDTISAGRMTYLWPPVVEQIGHSPLMGHGRYAIQREDVYERILMLADSVPDHPHCAYLEILLDGGVIGLLVCLLLLARVLVSSVALLRLREDRLLSVLGAVATAAVITELSVGVTGSSFYAHQSTVPMLSVMGAAMGAHRQWQLEKSRARAAVQVRSQMPRQVKVAYGRMI
jgi:O-antigen ligase